MPDEHELSKPEADDPIGSLHSVRFRRVANGYPRAVAFAYDGDIAAAALDSDEEVAARVAAWENAQGYLSDWQAIGEAEREE